MRLHLAIGEGGEHPAFARRLSFQRVLLPLEVQSLNDNRLASILCVRDNGSYGVSDESLGLAGGLAVGNQRHSPGAEPVARGIGLADGEMIDVQVNADGAQFSVCDNSSLPTCTETKTLQPFGPV